MVFELKEEFLEKGYEKEAVIGILFDTSATSSTTLFDTYKVDQLSIPYMNIFEQLKKYIDLNDNEFYAYKGSLTTPPCTESVAWFVFSKVLPITEI